MKWFKHDSDANRDAKIQKLIIKYGMQGYGLYWYCIELIANEIDEDNLTFELEHDSDVIAHQTHINIELVQEMMKFMVKQGLFENNDGVITCLKLAKRLDKSMTSNTKMRTLIEKIRNNHDLVMTESEKVMQEEKRREEIRREESTTGRKQAGCPYQKILDLWRETLHDLPQVRELTTARKAQLKSRWQKNQDLNWWKELFEQIRESPFLMGREPPTPPRTKPFILTLDWLIKEENFIKILEGRYHG